MALKFHLPERWPLYLFGALITSLTLVTLVGERGALHLWRLRGEKNSLDERNYRLQRENEALRQRIARIRNDNYYLEKLAREELNLVRPGEIIYRFPNTESGTARQSPPNELSARTRAAKDRKQSP
ncbi:MAG TPA: septum formation initiator family protein [Terriglobales bacterium]|nr:septum formation initiator family protein [Terriglobales bacterium]